MFLLNLNLAERIEVYVAGNRTKRSGWTRIPQGMARAQGEVSWILSTVKGTVRLRNACAEGKIPKRFVKGRM